MITMPREKRKRKKNKGKRRLYCQERKIHVCKGKRIKRLRKKNPSK